MWQSVEIDALSAGLSLEYFWGDITPKIYEKYIRAYNKRLEDEMVVNDITNFQLAQYIGANIADVLSGKKNAPKKPVLIEQIRKSRDGENKPVRWFSREETEAWLKQQELEKAKSK